MDILDHLKAHRHGPTVWLSELAATEITRLREENKRMREAMLHIEACATEPVSVTAAIDAIRVTAMVANHKIALATTGGE